jgi:hypothetical protein
VGEAASETDLEEDAQLKQMFGLDEDLKSKTDDSKTDDPSETPEWPVWCSTPTAKVSGILISEEILESSDMNRFQTRFNTLLKMETMGTFIPDDARIDVDIRVNNKWIKRGIAPLYVVIDMKDSKLFKNWDVSIVKRSSWRRFVDGLKSGLVVLGRFLIRLTQLLVRVAWTPIKWTGIVVLQVIVCLCRSARGLWRLAKKFVGGLYRMLTKEKSQKPLRIEESDCLDDVQDFINSQIEDIISDVEHLAESTSCSEFLDSFIELSTTFGVNL